MEEMASRFVMNFFGMSHTSSWAQTNDLGVNYAITVIHRLNL
jgi:hypothetical protein